MRAFAAAFFTHFGATLLADAQPDELVVDLPPALAGHFGRERLYLVFPTAAENSRELSPHEDLLVYGSRQFDLMLKLLAGQGQTARLAYPPQVAVEVVGAAMPLTWTGFIARQTGAGANWYHLFNYRVSYISDEKEEGVITVALDEAGQPAPRLVDWLESAAPLPQSPAAPPEVPAAELNHLLDQATAATRQRVADRLIELQQPVQHRLERVLLRLSGYYKLRMQDIGVDDPAEQERLRQELTQDLNRKIADELERHQLRVSVTPISYALAQIPTVSYQLTLTYAATAGASPARPQPPPPPPNLRPGLKWGDYRWVWLPEADYTVYVGRHFWRGTILLVQDIPADCSTGAYRLAGLADQRVIGPPAPQVIQYGFQRRQQVR
jgi:hypothetical protein